MDRRFDRVVRGPRRPEPVAAPVETGSQPEHDERSGDHPGRCQDADPQERRDHALADPGERRQDPSHVAEPADEDRAALLLAPVKAPAHVVLDALPGAEVVVRRLVAGDHARVDQVAVAAELGVDPPRLDDQQVEGEPRHRQQEVALAGEVVAHPVVHAAQRDQTDRPQERQAARLLSSRLAPVEHVLLVVLAALVVVVVDLRLAEPQVELGDEQRRHRSDAGDGVRDDRDEHERRSPSAVLRIHGVAEHSARDLAQEVEARGRCSLDPVPDVLDERHLHSISIVRRT